MPNSSLQSNSTQLFAARLTELSKAKGSYSHVARELGINRQQFARYLNGTSMPRDALLRKIADYFGVSTGSMFQTHEEAEILVRAPSPVFAAMASVFSVIEREEVQETDLSDGFYMYYRQSFLYPEKAVTQIARVTRTDDNVAMLHRKFSVRLLKDLPGIEPGHRSEGVFTKLYGSLMLFEVDRPHGDVLISAFKTSTMFSKNMKPGIVFTHGRAGNMGPVAGRHVLEKIPADASILSYARQQGFRAITELPEQVQYYFQRPDDLHENIIGLKR